jgi:DNA repair photolyase
MLEVCLELGFPVFVLTRSPLVLRDLDILKAINQRARATVGFSIIAAPDSSAYSVVCELERLSPVAEKRFAAMEKCAAAGLVTGTVAMPLLPEVCDTTQNLRGLVSWTAGHGGQFFLCSGLTLADQQKDYFLRILSQRCPELLPGYQRLYPQNSYSPPEWPWLKVARQVRELCQVEGIHDRMPRPVIAGEKRERNKRIVEKLVEKLYTLEIEAAPKPQIWAYRKAAWAVENLEQDVGLIHRTLGRNGLASIPGIGEILAGEIEKLLFEPHPVVSQLPGQLI